MSRSMEQRDVDGADSCPCSRVEAVFQAVSDFLDDSAKLIPSDQHDGISSAYSLVLFSDTAEAAFEATSLSAARSYLVAVKRRVRPYGGTRYGEGLARLSAVVERLERASGSTRHVCIFLSDGKPGDHVAAGLVGELEARLNPGRLKLHTVGFGAETRAPSPHGLERLAELGNGTFHDNSGVPAVAPAATEGAAVSLRPALPRQDGPAASAREGGDGRSGPQSALRSSGGQGSIRSSAVQTGKKTTVVTVKSSGRLSSSQLSTTFSALAQSALAEALAAELSAPALEPPGSSAEEAAAEESWAALRWVESDGVMKVAGHSGDVHAIDDDDVVKIVGDLSLKVRSVRWRPRPFAQGSMRRVHAMWDATGGEALPLVAKIPKAAQPRGGPVEASLATNRAFLEMHGHAAKCAAEFNRRLSSKAAQRVRFVDAYVYFLLSPARAIEHCFNAEPRLNGHYMKFNDNNGNVLSCRSESSHLAQAFSHFSYDYADSSSIIVDIQGVECEWTDPQMHSECGGRYGPGDLGPVGIKRFFASHRCNGYCRHLELQHPDPSVAAWPAAGALGASVVVAPASTLGRRAPFRESFASIPSLRRVLEEEEEEAEERSAKRQRQSQRGAIAYDSADAPS